MTDLTLAMSHSGQQSITIRKANGLFAGATIVLSLINFGIAGYFDTLGDTVPGSVLVSLLALAWWRLNGGSPLSYLVMPLLCVLAVGLHINAARGLPESHFLAFTVIAAAMAYRHWAAIISAAAAVAVHHLLVNELQLLGWNVICFVDPSRGRVVVHALYVIAETTVLLLLLRQVSAAFRSGNETSALFASVNRHPGQFDLRVDSIQTRTAVATQGKSCLTELADLIDRIHQGMREIASSAETLAAGSQSLNERTDQQAAGVHGTRDALDTIVNRAVENAGNAGAAGKSVADIRVHISGSNEQMNQLAQAMTEVASFSERIEAIVSVIDGFAFQTNILALNAAVEAARAGEQGRGFAVVATEVRSLAKRVATSAGEIRDLIEQSGQAVTQGAELANASGATVTQLVEATDELGPIIESIEAAAREQPEHVDSIRKAMQELAGVTDSNVALSEETAHITRSLKDNLAEVDTMLQRFVSDAAGRH